MDTDYWIIVFGFRTDQSNKESSDHIGVQFNWSDFLPCQNIMDIISIGVENQVQDYALHYTWISHTKV